MKIVSTGKRMLRGEVTARTAANEAMRRLRASVEQRRERAQVLELNQRPARLRQEFAQMSGPELLSNFRRRRSPQFLPGFGASQATAKLQASLFPEESNKLIDEAERIAGRHCWSLLGLGEKCFGAEEINWHLDPLSRHEWPLVFHADINLMRNDGSDARVVWELNRLGHLITLGRAYAITRDARLSTEFCRQLSSWHAQNPVGRGLNWNCAMEVALRAMNLLAAFALFADAPEFNDEVLSLLLMIFDQHGAHIERNLEFSHIATSNHYLADVTGLLWIGLMLPELQSAAEWREFGLRELLKEMDKQVLVDGADYEAATGYHRLKLELFLYSFVLCHLNGIDIPPEHWTKLRAMVNYVRAYLRPDGRAPLVGDSDSGQVLPVVRRSADDHAYVLSLAAAVFQESRFKTRNGPVSEELLWILGSQGVHDYTKLASEEANQSQAFPDAGIYIMRHDDLYLLFNASDSGVNGRGSHGHNDALSIEVSAGQTAFIVDPGSYVYTANLHERHLFRSTAYHSTVQVDGVEQNNIDESKPFIIGNQAQPRVIDWKTADDEDLIAGEHYGYQRLRSPVTHRRVIEFKKSDRYWLVDDELTGEGTHNLSFRFHFAPGLITRVRAEGIVEVWDKMNSARLLIVAHGTKVQPQLESRFSSVDYGAKGPSISACWSLHTVLPFIARFAIIPIRADENERERLGVVTSFSFGSAQTTEG